MGVANESGDLLATIGLDLRSNAMPMGAGPHHAWVVRAGRLLLYGDSGRLLASDAYSSPNDLYDGPVFNCDGSEWIWADQPSSFGGATRIYIGTQAVQQRLVLTYQTPGCTHLSPVRWVGNLVYLTEFGECTGAFHFIPAHQGAWVLNTGTGRLLQLEGSWCDLQDVSPDGTLLCLADARFPTLIRPDGSQAILRFPVDLFSDVGGGVFSPDGRYVALTADIDDPVGTIAGSAIFECSSRGGTLTNVGETQLVEPFLTYYLPDDQLVVPVTSGYVIASPTGAATPFRLPPGAWVLGVIPHPTVN